MIEYDVLWICAKVIRFFFGDMNINFRKEVINGNS